MSATVLYHSLIINIKVTLQEKDTDTIKIQSQNDTAEAGP